MLVDYDYYLDEYVGAYIDYDTFTKINDTAENVILTVVNPSFLKIKKFEDIIKRAICMEIDYLNQNDYEQIIKLNDTINIQSESYPAYSYTKKSGGFSARNIEGITIAPNVSLYLGRYGLLYSGVDYAI